MKIHTMITEDPTEICMILKFIKDFETRNTRPGYVKSTYRGGMKLAFEYPNSELDGSDDEAVATKKFGNVSGPLVGRFRKFCEANGFELKFSISC